ncbi:MAG: aminoacyl-tRNA hydrolase [Bacteroidales bacterium]
MKYLITGLGNIGYEYINTRHNVGFSILDVCAQASNIVFETKRYGDVAELRYKGRIFILLKPSTFMNLSGKAVNYWLQKEKIPIENLLVIADDMALPLGKLRLRKKGSDGGHNGLKNIAEMIGTQQYSRLRVGIGSHVGFGSPADFVLGKWTDEEIEDIKAARERAVDIIKAFGTIGPDRTMNMYNKK